MSDNPDGEYRTVMGNREYYSWTSGFIVRLYTSSTTCVLSFNFFGTTGQLQATAACEVDRWQYFSIAFQPSMGGYYYSVTEEEMSLGKYAVVPLFYMTTTNTYTYPYKQRDFILGKYLNKGIVVWYTVHSLVLLVLHFIKRANYIVHKYIFLKQYYFCLTGHASDGGHFVIDDLYVFGKSMKATDIDGGGKFKI